MKAWPPVRSVAGPLGFALVAALLLAAGGLGWSAAQRFVAGYDLLVFLYALLALGAGLGAAFLAYHLYGYWSLRYLLDRNALIIRWAGLRQVIPLERIRQAVAVADLPPADRPPRLRGLRWPGLWIGTTRPADRPPVLSYASAPPARQVLLVTPTLHYTISPAAPADFLADLAQRQALGPTQDLAQGTEPAGLAGHPLLSDRVALGLVIGGLLLNLALFGYLAFMYPHLPDVIALHWNTQGDPDRIGHPDELLRLPLIALALWGADLLGAALVHRRERLAALFLYAGAAVVQIVFWAAVLTIVLRVVVNGG
jgi:hypothetical protein